MVVYQIYPRSFQDSDEDGIGDLPGIASRLDDLVELGVDAVWLSPIHPSPLADLGYDISDYTAVDPVFGSIEDLDALVARARSLGKQVLMDLVPCHTSIEHPWFREHPDWYIWADGRDGGPPNNWRAAFGGSAWTFDEKRRRFYLHSFYPEQPDLDWRNPEVREAMGEVIRFWLDRGVAGYRVDAIDRILKDPELRDDPPASEPFGLPLRDDEAALALTHSRNAPDTGEALAAIRAAAGPDAFLVGEVYLPSRRWQPYLEHLDAVFAFELLFAQFEQRALRDAIEGTISVTGTGAAWVVSNHDFPRMPDRFGRENLRVAAMLLLTLPGTAFVYQGDEIGLGNGPGGELAFDRAGRDSYRHPMRWDDSPGGGFTTGQPWLPVAVSPEGSRAAQRGRPGSLFELYRELLALRPRLGSGFEWVDAADGVLAYRRDGHLVALNTTKEARPAPARGEPLLTTHPGPQLPAHGGGIWRD